MMDIFVDFNEMEQMLILAVQGILIIFWVISPIGGFVMARAIHRRSTSVLILAGMLLMFNVVFVGLTHLLTTQYDIANDTATLIALLTAFSVTLLLGGFTLYLYRNEKSAIDDELRNLINNTETNSDFHYQQRRQERIRRKSSRR